LSRRGRRRSSRRADQCGPLPTAGDDTCCFVACDFDGAGWTLTPLPTLTPPGPPVFQQPSSGLDRERRPRVGVLQRPCACQLGSTNRALPRARGDDDPRGARPHELRPALFPAQDFLPRQGFGTLIALPLQGECATRERPSSSTRRRWSPIRPVEFLAFRQSPSREAATVLAENLATWPVGPMCGLPSPRVAYEAQPPPARGGGVIRFHRLRDVGSGPPSGCHRPCSPR